MSVYDGGMKQARRVRKDKKLTLFEVARETGIDQARLSRFETDDKRQLELDALWKLADYYGCSTDDLLRPEPADPVEAA